MARCQFESSERPAVQYSGTVGLLPAGKRECLCVCEKEDKRAKKRSRQIKDEREKERERECVRERYILKEGRHVWGPKER